MYLCFDVGNTDIYGGVCRDGESVLEFRVGQHRHPSGDELGVFLLQILKARGVDPQDLTAVAVASVVPDSNRPIERACREYLGREPLFLRAGVRTGLKIRTKNPAEVGADRIANAMAAMHRFPGRDRIVVDMGTATTFCAIDREDAYLGGIIAAGLGLSMEALARNTAKLPYVDLNQPERLLGKTTTESMQSGLYLAHLGLLREAVRGLCEEAFAGREPVVIGTGGHARLFQNAGVFTEYVPGLVLYGLCQAVELNA
ncbi:MAG: type III pantothenate kinase [Verrucomicrobia bacterium]|jgi:type III pantothenate kinase|nr:type III pantothenate kinase [Verrucomicrobiota bacterium]